MSSAIPSYSMDAEQAVLGGLLLSNDKWDDVSLLLTEHNFYSYAHKQIYIAIRDLISHQ